MTRVAIILLASASLLMPCTLTGVSAAEPIEFDSRLSFACREVTPKDFRDHNPDRKVMEVTVRISASINVKEDALDSITYLLEFPDGVTIADFVPKTELGSEVAGPIEATATRSEKASLQVAIEGKGSVRYLSVASASAAGKAEAGGTANTASGVQIRYLPPKQVVLSAGTRDRGRVLAFKLRPFNQITLEGEKEFACLLCVPAAWKGACLKLKATGQLKGDAGDCVREMKVGLYVDGDAKKREEVEQEVKAFEQRRAEDPGEKKAGAFRGAWVGTWTHSKFGSGKLEGSVNEKGEFTGTLYDAKDKAWTSFSGTVKDGKATFTLAANGETGAGVLALDKQGRLTATFEHRTKAGDNLGSFKVLLTRQ